jgi:hypothetical protein
MKTLALASALVLAAASASAQPVVDRALRAPSAELAPAPVPAAEAPLALPDLPAVPPELAARVTSLRAVVDETRECFTFPGVRDEHIADRRCPGWFAALNRGGAAAAHAIGAALEQDFRGAEVDYENVGNGAGQVRPRILRLLTANGGPVATTYLLRYVARALAVDHGLGSETSRAAFATLASLAGEDLTRVAPWEGSQVYRDRERMTAAVQRWLRWHRDVAVLPRAQQLALAAQRQAEALASADQAERWAAIQRAAAVPARRASAVTALRGLLAHPELTAQGRSYLLRWARRQGMQVAAPRAALAAR